MQKNVVCIAILILVLVGTSLLAFKTLQGMMDITSGNTLHVGPGFPYATIQSAVNNASDGDTIEVINASTPYYENVVVNRSVTIKPYSGNYQSPRVVGGFNVTSSNVTINNITIRDGNYGIQLASSGNTISGNTITNNTIGLDISGSSNAITANTITTNTQGGLYVRGYSNILRTNNITGNKGWNFGMDPTYQDIDPSNTINGKPIYYWVNKTGESIPTNASYVCVINSTNITIGNLVLENNYQGVLAAYSSHINVTNVNSTVFAPEVGIEFHQVSNSTIQNTNLADISSGIELLDSDNNVIANNVISSSNWGIILDSSVNCSIVANNLTNLNNQFAFQNASRTVIFHNNIQGEAHALNIDSSDVRFDNGYEGNYWSNYVSLYHGQDLNGTGIGSPPYPINAGGTYYYDYCPLMQPWSETRIYNRTLAFQSLHGLQYTMKLSTYSNSTLSSSVVFSRYDTVSVGVGINVSKGEISLNVTAGYEGFLNITIPRNWLDGIFNVTINGGTWVETANVTCSSIYITFGQGTHTIRIDGLEAGNIPGDINGDGKVSLSDLVILANNYGSSENP